ncbi:unnamed protein product [Dicrocoelium dendriticum]|nr:unnamed protein product [Dicrocoelium dendriticum]
MAEDATCDRGRKQMPSITTYTSDDSFDEEDLSSSLEETSKIIADMRSITDVQNGILPHLSDSASNSPSTTDEDDFPDVSDKLVHIPVTQLISSEQFSAICTQRSRQCKSSTSCAKPVTWDPRWNGQYCSAACVSEHCRLAFVNWCAGKRFVAATATGPSRVPPDHGLNRVKPEVTDSPALSEGSRNESASKLTNTFETENSSLVGKLTKSQTNREPFLVEPPVYTKPEPPDPDSAILHRKPLFETLSFALPNSRSNSAN